MQGLPKTGDVLDDTYRIEELIGKGGFGAVYRALQLSMQREVALKILVAHALNVDEMIERFRREVMAVRTLGHPNTIRIYDFRDRADGLLYYSMEYIRGPTLQDVIEGDGPMSPSRAGHILKQTLKSLSEAHSHGIVHRDLKPANIMLADVAGETDFVKVLDFGIAKILDGDDAEERKQITSAGVLVGTLNYMSPEQIAGGEINPSSDLYALALIGVEMLTGRSVFAGTGQWEVLHKQISDEPVEIPDVVAQSALGPLLLRALEKRQDKRFRRAEDMLDALAALGTLSDAPLLDPSEIPDSPTRQVKVESKPPPGPTAPTAPVNSTPAPATADSSFESAKTALVDAPTTEDDVFATRPEAAIQPVHASEPQRTKSNLQETHPAISATPEPATQQPVRQPTLSPTGQQQTRQNLDSTAFTPIEDAPAASGGSNTTLLLVAIVAVLLVVALTITLVVVVGGTDETSDELPTTPPEVAAVETPPPSSDEPSLPPEDLDQPAPATEVADDPSPEPMTDPVVTTKQVRLLTPDVQAQVFSGGKLIGETPMSVGISKAETYRLSAKGYEAQEVALSPESDDVVDVKLVRVVVKDDSASDTTPARAKPDDGWVDIPVKRDRAKTQNDTEKKKKNDVPVF